MNGIMCAIGDVGPEYNKVPLAVTNVEGTEDAASADRFGWILPFALTRNGESSRATAVRALRECVNFAIDESSLRPHGWWLGDWGFHDPLIRLQCYGKLHGQPTPTKEHTPSMSCSWSGFAR